MMQGQANRVRDARMMREGDARSAMQEPDGAPLNRTDAEHEQVVR